MNWKYFLLPMLCLIGSKLAFAQSGTISGLVVDSTGTPLVGASVVLLQQADSVLAKFDITDEQGRFALEAVVAKKYQLNVTYIGYEPSSQLLAYSGKSLTLPPIQLHGETHDLQEVLVEAERAPIVIKGDTIQYNADAFKTKPNAVVEDLLKKLPGVEVDRNGQIKAQGKDVDKVLVDGKEFFGDDPKIATQNLPADIVDKVQVFDRKSETAEFTGVDDGERNTTINLGLKKDKNKGYFGTLDAGYGTEDRFQFRGNLNRFTSKTQLSGIGRSNNINEQGFSIMDYIDFMGGLQNAFSGGSLISPEDLGINFDGDSRQNGFVTTAAGGLNLNHEFSDKLELSSSYFYNRLDRDLDREVDRQNYLGDDQLFESEEMGQRNTVNNNHRLNTRLDYEIDSTSDLQLRANIGFNDTDLATSTFLQNYNVEGSLENSTDREYQAMQQQLDWEARAVYRKKLQKPGRSLVADASAGMRDGMGNSDLGAINAFVSEQILDSLFQQQNTDNRQWRYNTRLTYTEPIGKGQFLEANYRRQNYQEVANKDFFDIVNGQLFRNANLSNQFTNDYTFDRGGLTYQLNRKKSNFTASLDFQESRLNGSLQSEVTPLSRSFQNWLPGLRWRYEFTNTKNLEVSYRTSIREPSIQQLQPLIDNSDPLSIYSGNPALQPEYQHSIRLQTMIYDAFSFASFMAFLNATYTQDKITNATTIDEQLRQTIEPINVKNDFILNGNVSYGTPLRFMKSRINLSTNFTYNRGLLFVNTIENSVDRLNGSLRVSLENRKKEVVDMIVGGTLGYTSTQYAVNQELNQSFANQSYFVDFTWYIDKNWTIATVFDYTIFPKGPFDTRQTLPIWEASISRYILKDQRGQLRLSAFDLLNRNIGVNRNASFNYIENERLASLGRYFMLSFVYKLKGFGG